jgi:hypothetical protein
MERQRDTDWVEKEREASISLQRVRRKGFNRIQNSTPGPSSSVNARTEPDVEMEEGGVIHAAGGREKDREAEKDRPNRSNNKGKSKDVPVDNEEEQPIPSHLRSRHTPKPKSTGRPAQAQAGSWNDIKRRKKNASTKSRTFLHAQVASSFVILCSCSRYAQVDVDDNGTDDDEDKVMENKRRKPSGQRTDDDDDSDSDEGDIRLSASKLKKVMADIMHDVFNEKSPRRGRSQSKQSKALRDEKKLDAKWERKSFCVSHCVDGDNRIQI